MSQNLRTKAIVLRRTNYGEADRILQILTPENGKLAVMAKGVRREKSRLAGGIELFAICDLSLAKSDKNISEMWTFTGSKLNTFFAQIMTDYDKLQFGYEAIKHIAKAAEQIDGPEFYELLRETLAALDNTKIELKITQIWFYLSLAKLLGNELNLATDQSGMKLVEDARYDFDQTDQVFVFNKSGHYSTEKIKLLRVLTSNPPAVAAKITDTENLLDDCLWIAKNAAKV